MRPSLASAKRRRPVSRRDKIKLNLAARGASADLQAMLGQARRKGTVAVYDHRWRKWIVWCRGEKIDPFSPSDVELGNFLVQLSTRGLACSTVLGYRSAICTTLSQLGGSSLSESPLLRDLSKGLAHNQARSPRRTPAWDLLLVLDFLRKAPFEPLDKASFERVSLKTTFLLALASSRRRSEINAFSGNPLDTARHPDGSYTLRFLPEFLAKNLLPSDPSPSVVIRPLSDLIDPGVDSGDFLLCPVRSLAFYLRLRRTRALSQRKLLISLNDRYHQDVSPATTSRWISQVVREAYVAAGKDPTLSSSRAHEVRAIASSVAFHHSAPLREILGAAYWKSENPFISFYLRDFRMVRENGSKGISFVAANTAIRTFMPPLANTSSPRPSSKL